MSAKQAFGAGIAVILLVLYIYLVGAMVWDVHAFQHSECVSNETVKKACAALRSKYHEYWLYAVNLIGGLISALVIAYLAVTPVGKSVATRFMNDLKDPSFLLNFVTWAYIGIWVVLGLAAFWIGTLNKPTVLPALKDLGIAWLGITVGAAYAYLGVEPKKSGSASWDLVDRLQRRVDELQRAQER